jgi:autotransporter-associated beta strand protein
MPPLLPRPMSVQSACFALSILWVSAGALPAVIIEGGDGTGNTTAPADAIGNPGWANVGRGNDSSVYLGNRWVLTAAHVGSANTILNGVTYNKIAGSAIRLHESADGNSANSVDLLLYRIDADPGLPSLSIADFTPSQGSLVTAIGYGTDRGMATAYGFLWGAANWNKRWGRNLISSSSSGIINLGSGNTHVFQTMFDLDPVSSSDPALALNEFQASSGDSGGAVFYKGSSGWKLAGILDAVTTNGSANYGNVTYSVDLSYYKSQILDTMATCPFSGTIVDPVSTLGAGVSAYLSGEGGFRPSSGTVSVAVDTKSFNFTFDTGSNTISQTGAISGSGGLIKNGIGNLKLSEHNSYSGNTTVNQGTLTLDGGDLGNSPLVSLAAGTNLDVIRGTLQLGVVSGRGSVSVSGASTLLTAQSIQTDSLTIGAIHHFAASSDRPAVNPVPEPSGLMLLCTISLTVFAAFGRRMMRC